MPCRVHQTPFCSLLIHSLHLNKPLDSSLLTGAGSGEQHILFKCIKHLATPVAGSEIASYNSRWSQKNLSTGFNENWVWLEKSQISDNSLLNIVNHSDFLPLVYLKNIIFLSRIISKQLWPSCASILKGNCSGQQLKRRFWKKGWTPMPCAAQIRQDLS